MNKLVSVILPVYNVEKYIKRCLESIMNQTYKNIEIIIIDDGSKDNTSYICKSYTLKDKRIKYYKIKNGGVSHARNIGIDYSKGEYIIFIDGDDWIDYKMFELMVNSLEKYNSDIVVCNHCKTDGTEFIKESYFTPLTNFKNLILDPKYRVYGYLPTKMLKKNKIIKKLREDIYYSEDLIFLLENFSDAKYSYVDELLYYYFINESSAMNSKFNERRVTILESDSIVYHSLNNEIYMEFYLHLYLYHYYNIKYYLKKYGINKSVDKYKDDIKIIKNYYKKNLKIKYLTILIKDKFFCIYYIYKYIKDFIKGEQY